MNLIQFRRNFVRECAEILLPLRDEKDRRSQKSVKELIYGLNTLFAGYPLLKYARGLPDPAATVRQLDRLLGMIQTAIKTGNTAPLVGRLTALPDTDARRLVLFQAALRLNPDRPEQVVQEPETASYLTQTAAQRPSEFAEMVGQARAGVRPLARTGKGGARNRGKLSDRDVVLRVGLIFERVVGRRPGITFREDGEDDGYGGPFLRFAQAVFRELGREIGGRQVFRLYRAASVGRWRSGKRRTRRWKNPFSQESGAPESAH